MMVVDGCQCLWLAVEGCGWLSAAACRSLLMMLVDCPSRRLVKMKVIVDSSGGSMMETGGL